MTAPVWRSGGVMSSIDSTTKNCSAATTRNALSTAPWSSSTRHRSKAALSSSENITSKSWSSSTRLFLFFFFKFVCVCVCLTHSREYAETVGRKVHDLGMVVDLIFLNTEVSLTQALEDVGRARTPFAIIITQQHQVHRSCTVNILFGTPQGNFAMLYLVTCTKHKFQCRRGFICWDLWLSQHSVQRCAQVPLNCFSFFIVFVFING